MTANENLSKAEYLLNTEFSGLISDTRKNIILRYLEFRFSEFDKLLK